MAKTPQSKETTSTLRNKINQPHNQKSKLKLLQINRKFTGGHQLQARDGQKSHYKPKATKDPLLQT